MADRLLIDFGGLPRIRGLHGSLTRGVSPSIFTLYHAPFSIPDGGTGTLTFGTGDNVISFSDCAIAGSFVRQYSGLQPVQATHIADRRWKWKHTVVSGTFNVRTSEGTVDPATKQEPGELAAYILRAMGETSYNTSQMPTGVYPPATWNNKRGDLALKDLCDYVACVPVLNPSSNVIEIWPLGTGEGSGEGQLGKTRHVPRTRVPGLIECRTGPVRWQTRLKLRPVSRNASFPQQKHIDEIEYKPQGGWQLQSPFTFQSLTNTLHRAIAFATIWREYRVTGQADGSLLPPFCNQQINSVNQYVLDDYLIETETDVLGYKKPMPYYIGGSYWPYTDLPENCDPEQYYNGEATLYKDRLMVTFPVPVHGFNASGQPVEPTLYLFTSYRVKTIDGEFIYLFRSNTTGSQTGGKLILERPEIFAIFNTAGVPGSAQDTSQQAFQEADNYVNIFLRKYQNPNASEVTVPGFVPGLLNGNLAQLTWNLTGNTTPWTKGCEQEELDPFSPGELERNVRELAEGTA